MSTTEISSTEALASISREQEWVVADFRAGWCGPCKSMAPAFERVAARRCGYFAAVKIDIGRHPELARLYGIRVIPTLLLFHRGVPVDQLTGSHAEREIDDWISTHLVAGVPQQHKISSAG